MTFGSGPAVIPDGGRRMSRLVSWLHTLWRSVTTPKAAREIEDSSPEAVVNTLPDLPPVVTDVGEARHIQRRLDAVERRDQEEAERLAYLRDRQRAIDYRRRTG